jgi:hypothetical protein
MSIGSFLSLLFYTENQKRLEQVFLNTLALSNNKYSCHILFSLWQTNKYFVHVRILSLYETSVAHAHQEIIRSIQIHTAFGRSFFCSYQKLSPHLRLTVENLARKLFNFWCMNSIKQKRLK